MESMEKTEEQTAPTKPLRCIVKLGGAAVTCKNDIGALETAMLLGGAIGMFSIASLPTFATASLHFTAHTFTY
ncbi:hypothetical protein Dimus_026928 [Dionaea muscipula]